MHQSKGREPTLTHGTSHVIAEPSHCADWMLIDHVPSLPNNVY